MEKSLCILICFLSAVTFGYSQLLCYDCDPQTDRESCNNPANTSARTTNCNAYFENTINATNATVLCVSAFINFTGEHANDTGIYRGCKLQNQDVANFCDWFGQENNTQNRTITSCGTCNTTRCNTHTFRTNGTMNNSGTIISQTMLSVLVLSIIFVVVSF